MKYFTLFTFIISFIIFTGCRPVDPLINEINALSCEIESIHQQIDSIRSLSSGMDAPYWQMFYELEVIRHRVTLVEKDSIDEFYKNYVFRFRRPITAVLEPDRSSPFLFPVSVTMNHGRWEIPIIWGRLFYFDYNHLGIDVFAREGDTVRAIYDGVIRHYESAGGYGDLVVVIEHQYSSAWKNTSITPVFISVYGHLRKKSVRENGASLPWKDGDKIRKGEVIGFINDDEHNGDGGEHLHFGIRLQSADDAKRTDSGRWLRGYDNQQGVKLRYFMDPIDFYGRYIQFIFPSSGY